MNGKNWNVREAYRPGEIKFTVDETGTKILEKTEGSFVVVDDDKHVMTEGDDGKIIDTAKNSLRKCRHGRNMMTTKTK